MSNFFNMVSVSAIMFADASADGEIPTELKSINVLSEGKLTPDFNPGELTSEINEFNHLPHRNYRGNSSYKFTMELPKIPFEDYASFTGCDYDPVTFELSMGSSAVEPKPKYFKIYGGDPDGNPLVMQAFCCDVVSKWSGSVGSAQATVPVSIECSMRTDNGTPAKMMSLKPVV
ncbi:MAG: hypothetical protein WCS17_12770 [Prevotella sp.]